MEDDEEEEEEEVFRASRLVWRQAVKIVPSSVRELGDAVVILILVCASVWFEDTQP